MKAYLFLLFWIPLMLKAQVGADSLLHLFQLSAHQAIQASDTHTYLISTPSPSANQGLLIFCHGSLPVPLLIETPQGPMGVLPFSHFPYLKSYRIALIAKPGIPLYAQQKDLQPNFSYHVDGGQPEFFRQRNYLDWYVNQGKTVLDRILADETLDTSRIVLLGHSQGAKVAAKWASEDPRITHLGYLSGNPQGRFEQYIRSIRQQEDQKEVSAEEAQQKIEELYGRWSSILHPKGEDFSQGDLPQTTISFSAPTLDELLSLEIPLYVAYGTADLGARTCDMLPLEFMKAAKSNLTHKAYPGWEHNFFGTDEEGNIDYGAFHWEEVMKAFMKWVQENSP